MKTLLFFEFVRFPEHLAEHLGRRDCFDLGPQFPSRDIALDAAGRNRLGWENAHSGYSEGQTMKESGLRLQDGGALSIAVQHMLLPGGRATGGLAERSAGLPFDFWQENRLVWHGTASDDGSWRSRSVSVSM